jgi:hypothetical protein
MRTHGYAVWSHASGRQTERDTFRCAHHGGHVVIPPGKAQDVSGWCSRCAALVCVACASTGRCVPLERQIKAMEARGRMLAAMGIQ